MKILFIASQVDLVNSSAAIRNCTLINGLAELGHEVHIRTIAYPDQFVSSYLASNVKAASIEKTSLPIYRYNQSVESKRILKNGSFLRELLKKIRSILYFPDISITWFKHFDYSKLDSDYDLLISSSDSKVSHLIAENVKKMLNIRWIQVWGDPWSNDSTATRFQQLRARRHEARLLTKADKVIYVSKATHVRQQELFAANRDKMFYVPRGFMTKVETENVIRENQISISYTGNLFWGRSVSELINALRKFNESSEIKFVLDIYGVKDERFIEATSNEEFVHIYPPVDYQQVFDVYGRSNILLFISNSSTSTQIPGKFFDYSGTTRPVLCLMSDDKCAIAEYLKTFDRCLVINNDEETILNNSGTLVEMASRIYEIPAEFIPKEVAAKVIE